MPRSRWPSLLLAAALLLFAGTPERRADDILETDVLVAGGGTGGVAAALQAARDGMDVVVMEPTPWLGGMLTAAGVSATDGNHRLPSGLWGEFRQRIRDHYGGADSVATGWVSHTLFEPHVGHAIWRRMVEETGRIQVHHGYRITEALMDGRHLRGAVFRNEDGHTYEVRARLSIDATEYGDLMAHSGTAYALGQDARAATGEDIAPARSNDIIQDLTYTAILKNYGEGADKTIPRPPNYQPSIFENACREASDDPAAFEGVDCETMLNYARLPNDKYLINWPLNGNDYYLNVIEQPPAARQVAYEAAKNRTRQFIYFIQTELGYRHLGLADDEYDTEDRLPYLPYLRETRRLDGVVQMTMMDLEDMYHRPLYRTGIAVGDYPLDHHRVLNPSPPTVDDGDLRPHEFDTHDDVFPPIPSFTVPFGTLVPQETRGLLVAEKSISVTSIANGSTRLQPVVMGIGQAAGAAAAQAIRTDTRLVDLDLRALQQHLIDAGCWMLPFLDSTPDDWHFAALQRAGLAGVLKGEGIPVAWANETRIYPDSTMTRDQIDRALEVAATGAELAPAPGRGTPVARSEALRLVWERAGAPAPESMAPAFADVDAQHDAFEALQYAREQGWTTPWVEANRLRPDAPITRKAFAYAVDRALAPFERHGVRLTDGRAPSQRSERSGPSR